MKNKQKIYNALWAQAIADAVGNPFEFKENIPPMNVVDYYHNDLTELVISDDTQMAMFGFEAMHTLLSSGLPLTSNRLQEHFIKSYLDWYHTQTTVDFSNNLPLDGNTGLLGFRSMFSVQSPGGTCMVSLYNIREGKTSINDSKGCGSVMRLLPLLLLFQNGRYPRSRHEIVEYAVLTGEITHHHVENSAAISLYMHFAMDLLSFGYSNIDRSSLGDDFYTAIPKISHIGDGWTALEAVEMAIWAYQRAESFEQLLALSIAHDGDSDSVAAIAGSLWGLAGKPIDLKVIRRLDAVDALLHLTLMRND